MSKRLLTVAASLALLSTTVGSVQAQSRVVAQKTSKGAQGTIFLKAGLRSGHAYRLDVSATGRHPFAGDATENYLGVTKGRLVQGTKPILLNGTTPRSFAVNQPVSGSLSSWYIGLNVRLKAGSNLTIKLVDLGRHK